MEQIELEISLREFFKLKFDKFPIEKSKSFVIESVKMVEKKGDLSVYATWCQDIKSDCGSYSCNCSYFRGIGFERVQDDRAVPSLYYPQNFYFRDAEEALKFGNQVLEKNKGDLARTKEQDKIDKKKKEEQERQKLSELIKKYGVPE